MAVSLAERSFGRTKIKGPFPGTVKEPFTKVRRGTFGESIKWVQKTRAWAPDSGSLLAVRGIRAGDVYFDPKVVDKTFVGEEINSKEARRIVGVRNWRRPWSRTVPHYAPDES